MGLECREGLLVEPLAEAQESRLLSLEGEADEEQSVEES